MSEQELIKDTKKQVTCFHDGECPLCELEINMMKKADKSNSIQWVDITKDKQALEDAGISYQQAMDQIHVLDDNKMQVGVDGFISLWRTLPYYRFLVFFVRLPFIYPIAKVGYKLFARYRLVLTGRKSAKEE